MSWRLTEACAVAVLLLAALASACGGRDSWLHDPLPERPPVVPPAPVPADAPRVRLVTSAGELVIALYEAHAPVTVANFLEYVDAGFYDGTIVHRVEKEFPGPPVIQGGGYTPDFERKPTRPPIVYEGDNGLRNVRGSVAMARGPEADSASSQFYVNYRDNPGLDHRPGRTGYTVFGVVVEGMATVDRITMAPVSPRPGTTLTRLPMVEILVESVRRER